MGHHRYEEEGQKEQWEGKKMKRMRRRSMVKPWPYVWADDKRSACSLYVV